MTKDYILPLEQQLAQQEELITTFKKDQKASIKVFQQQKKTIENLERSNSNLMVGNERLSKSNEQLKTQAKIKDKNLKDLQKENKSLTSEITLVNQAKLKNTSENKNLSKELTSYKQKHSDLTQQNSSLVEKYSSLNNSYENLSKTLTSKDKELTSYQAKNQILEDKISELENQAKESNLPPPIEICANCSELEQEKEEILTQAEMARNEMANELEEWETKYNNLLSQKQTVENELLFRPRVEELTEKDKTLNELQAKNQELNKTIETLKNQGEPTENKPEPLKTFLCSECQQTKPQEELSRQFGKYSFCLECSKKARQTATQQKTKPQPLDFTCHLCEKPKTEIPTKMKLDETLQEYLICQECRPLAKEFNEADLITDDLWNKYPYSSASEILEKEFGIVKK